MPAMSAKGRYEKLASGPRQQFLSRARHNSMLSIPSLVPLEGHDQTSHLIEPYQGLGATLVSHLASRMAISMLPASRPYMRFAIPPKLRLENNGEVEPDVERGMAISEELVQTEVEAKDWRDATNQEMQQLLVAGSVAEKINADNTIRVYRLDQYVVRHDNNGDVLEFVLRDLHKPDGLRAQGLTPPSGVDEDEDVPVFTWGKLIARKSGVRYEVQQYLDESMTALPGTKAVFERDLLPYLFHKWSKNPGEDYGRAKTSDHIGDLRSLEVLSKDVLEMAAMAGRHFIMVRPGAGGFGLARRITKARNGDVVVGNHEDVDVKSFVAGNGYQIVEVKINALSEGLSRAFLMTSVAQRQAERVTATEIQRDVEELEAALGGVFSQLSNSMLLKRTRVLINNMQQAGELPEWPQGGVVPQILTGLEALSRQRDAVRAEQAAGIIQMFGEEALDAIKLPNILNKAFAGLGLAEAVRTQQELEEEQERKAQLRVAEAGQQALVDAAAQAEE